VRRAARAIHNEQATAFETGAIQQLRHLCRDRIIFERFKTVEQRGDKVGVGPYRYQVEGNPQQPQIQPPPGAAQFHQPQCRHYQWSADDDHQDDLFGEIADEQGRRRLVKTEAGFQFECLVDGDR